MTIEVFTIGFTKTTAEHFFERVKSSNTNIVIDVRLNNTSQLAAFAKAKDLKFFLKTICNVDYLHQPILAPTQDILTEFKKNKGDWSVYKTQFLNLMANRKIEDQIKPDLLNHSCLLCSEDKPHHCHRSLVCDYLNLKWGSELSVSHL